MPSELVPGLLSPPSRVTTGRRTRAVAEPLEARRLMRASIDLMADDPAAVQAQTADRAVHVDVGSVEPFVDSAGSTTWAADAGFIGGKSTRGGFAVEGTEDDVLFASRRVGNFAYSLPAADGGYVLSLLFVDTVKRAGKRTFDVTAEGRVIEDDLDVVARAGRRTALVVNHAVTVSGGALEVAFTSAKGKAVLSGLSLMPAAAAAPTPSPEPTPAPAPERAPSPPGPASLAWEDAETAPVSRVEAGGIQVGTSLYIWGGYRRGGGYEVNDRFDVFDMATRTWAARRPSPAPETHAALATDGRYIYAAGGQYGGGLSGTPSADTWRYDTLDDTWSSTALPDLPEARYGGGMGLLDNKLYFFAGNRPDRTTVAQDLWALDLGNPSAGWVAKAPLPPGLSGDHISAAVADGRLYAVGGEHGHAADESDTDAPYIQHRFLMAYDPATDVWTRKADLPDASSHHEAATLVVNGKIVVLGGQNDDIKVTSAVRLYDPADDTWSLLAGLPQRRKGGVAGYLDGQLFYTGGQRDGDWLVSTDTWVGEVTGV